MSAVCPACGVAVVPGYAKCPRCQKPLPNSKRAITAVAGGTVAEDRRFPWMLIAVPLGVVIVIGLFLKMVAGGSDEDPPTTQPVAIQGPAQPQGTVVAQAVEPPPQQRVQPTQPAGPDPTAATAELERLLRSRRLWSSIETATPRIDVRSGFCDDPNMRSSIDSVAAVLRRAGLTRLRCLAQSGTVVFERDL